MIFKPTMIFRERGHWWSRVPAILLASVALLISLSVPVRAVISVRGGEEIIEIDEGKFVQQQTYHSRRHRRLVHKEEQFFRQPEDDEVSQVAFPTSSHAPLSFWTTTPPLLRAPPARV